MKKAPQERIRYVPGRPSGRGREEDSLVSTKYALRFLYEEALRNDQYAMAVLLRDTLEFCDEIIGDKR